MSASTFAFSQSASTLTSVLRPPTTTFLPTSTAPTIATTVTTPPPLPEHEWIGKTTLNYTTLHHELAEPMGCINVPLGALGFYFYFVLHAFTVYNTHRTNNLKKVLKKCVDSDLPTPETPWYFGLNILMLLYSLFRLYESIQARRDCFQQYGAVGNADWLGIVWSIVTITASIIGSLAAYNGLPKETYGSFSSTRHLSLDNRLKSATYALYAYMLGSLLTFPPPLILCLTFFNDAHIIRPRHSIPPWLDSVYLPATIVSEIPTMLVTIAAGVQGYRYCLRSADSGRKKARNFSSWTVVLALDIVTLIWVAAAYVALGKIFGSPWGEWWVRRANGQAHTVFAGVVVAFPVLQGLFSLGGSGT